jgi:hypothetical protein
MVWNQDDNNDNDARQRRVGYWTQLEHERMDATFGKAMEAAGYSSTMPSTCFGTKAPIAGYQRP